MSSALRPAGGGAAPEAAAAADRVTRAYESAAHRPGSALADAGAHLGRTPSLALWKGGYHARPLFVPEDDLLGFAADLERLLGLLTSLPERLFGGDSGALAAALGVTGPRGELMRSLGGAAPPHYGRADAYHDGTAFRLLEFGTGSDVGGWDRAGEIPRALLEIEEFADFAEEHGLAYTHTGREMALALREAGRGVTGAGREPVVALIEGPGGLAAWGDTWRPLQQLMCSYGLDFRLGELGELRATGDGVRLRGSRVDVVYRTFETDQIVADPDALAALEGLLRAHEAGQAVLFTPLESNLFCDKGCLSLLSDPAHGAALDAAERALVDRVLPWTRTLRRTSSAAGRALVEQCRARREELILKPADRYGGQGIVPGWEAAEQDWRRALEEGAGAGWVVQERITPRAEPLDGRPWHAAWGFFYTPRGHAGAYARALPAGRGAVIGVSANEETRTAGVFHYRADAP